MRNVWRSGAVTLAMLAAVPAPAAVPDRGGLTFDFPAVSARHYAWNAADGTNLVRGSREGTSGSALTAELPDADGGTCRLSFHYTMSHPELSHKLYVYDLGGVRVFAGGRQLANLRVFFDRGERTAYSRTFSVPKGVTRLELKPYDSHGGKLTVSDVSLVRVPDRDVELFVSQVDALDGTFALSRGQMAFLMVSWRRRKEFRMETAGAEFTLTLPKGVELEDAGSFADAKTIVRTDLADGAAKFVFKPRRDMWIAPSWNHWSPRGLLLRAASDAPDRCGRGRLELRVGGREVADAKEIEFLAIDALPRVAAGRRYRNGIDYSGGLWRVLESERGAKYADFLADRGVRCMVYEGSKPEVTRRLRSAGVDLLTPACEYCANGYQIRNPAVPIPPEEQFVPCNTKDEDFLDKAKKSLCPVAVYTEGAYFKNQFLPYLKTYLTGADGLWANWEPHEFRNHGCACARCRSAFARHLGVDEKTLDGVWPEKALKVYGKRYDDFRSKEHAKLMRTLQKHVTAFTGGEKGVGFIAGVEWSFMGPCWRDEDPAPEYRIREFADSFRWLEVWGPYAAWEADKPYVYLKNKPLANFVAAKAMRTQVDADYPLPNRPKIMAYPHGLQGTHWVSQPEHISMSLDCYFFNRWSAAYVYFFPKGYDNRYWRAFSEAAARAGRYEDFVLDGHETTDLCTLTPVREYAAPCRCPTYYVPSATNVTFLQHAAFDLGGRRIVAVLNFWQKGEAFFTLKTRGLAEGSYAVVDEKGLLYARKGGGTTWTAAELARGVRLMVGAARTRVFEILPASGRAASRGVVGAEELEELYRKRREDLGRAAETDRRDSERNPPPRRDYMPVI